MIENYSVRKHLQQRFFFPFFQYISGNGSFRSYSRSDPSSFWFYSHSDPRSFRSYSLLVRSFRPGLFRSDFRGGSFRPNFGGSFRPTLIYIDFWVVNFFLAILDCFYADLVGDPSLSGFLDLLHAVFIHNKSIFLT